MSLKSNIWWTRKAKIQQETRLLRLERHSQLLLIWFSFFTLCASILSSSSKTQKLVGLNESFDPNLLTVFSILTLVMSCFVIALNFKERAIKIKNCYEELNTLDISDSDVNVKYSNILGKCENHTEMDFLKAKFNIYFSTPNDKRKTNIDKEITNLEYIKLAINSICTFIVLAILYLLPIFLLNLHFS